MIGVAARKRMLNGPTAIPATGTLTAADLERAGNEVAYPVQRGETGGWLHFELPTASYRSSASNGDRLRGSCYGNPLTR
jgi:hypothetical protein